MAVILDIPRVWELIKRFKDECQSKGWKTSEHEDWVKAGNEYHNFLWIRMIHPSTFEKVATTHKCAIRERLSYQVVDVSYTAWLFPQTPPEELIQMIMRNRELSRKTAIYDLSWAYEGKPVCFKLNKTDSRVFREFERFMEEKLGVKVKPVYPLSTEVI